MTLSCHRAQAATLERAPAEEFVGPFRSWLNVKTEFGAVGDGVADDTGALQKAFDAIRAPDSKRKVLYFPSGTYRITGTLRAVREAHYESLGISVYGEDPATTIIKWDGPQDGVMLEWGAWFSKISRLTLDGAGKAGTAMRHGRMFSTANEISDMTFENTGFGIEGGYFDAAGIAEDSVLRCRFVRCSKAGVSIQNFNSLDWWLRYCLFEDCRVGVTDEFGAGNFHVYQSLFRRSTEADITITHTQFFSFRNNVSIGSKAFFVAKRAAIWKDSENWGGQITIQGNFIANTGDATPIRIASSGATLLFDNTIVSPAGSTAPALQQAAPAGECDAVAIGNTFTVADPLQVQGRLTAFDNKIVKARTVKVIEPVLPPTPPDQHRAIFDVADGANGAAIQAAIDAAVASNTTRPVVHIPNGNFNIDNTLVIPAGTDLQLVGDGLGDMATRLNWTGSGDGPVLRLQGPSRAVVGDLQIVGNNKGNGLVVEDCDQIGGRVWMQGSEIAQSSKIGLLVNGIEQAGVQMLDFGHASNGTGVRIVAGPREAAGKPASGRITIYSGNSSANDLSYDLTSGARLLVRDTWYETGPGSGKHRFFRLNGNSRFTLHGALAAIDATQDIPAIEGGGFRGAFALLATNLVSVSPQPARIALDRWDTDVLIMGNLFAAPQPVSIVGGIGQQRVAIVGNRISKPNGSVQLPDSPIIDQDLVRSLLADTREAAVPVLGPIKPGRTDVKLDRVFVVNCPVAMQLNAN